MIDYLRLEMDVSPSDGEHRPFGESRRWWGPVLRRVLGKELIEGHCPVGRPLCEGLAPGNPGPPVPPIELCRLAEKCPYGVLFAGSLSRRPPFALHVPPGKRGLPFDRVEVTLLGPGTNVAPQTVLALGRALRRGVGRRRLPFDVLGADQVHWQGGRKGICGPFLEDLPDRFEPDSFDASGSRDDKELVPVEVEFRSPTRIKHRGRLLKDGSPVQFDLLLGRILDRCVGIYGDEMLRTFDADRAKSIAATVPLVDHDVEWVEVEDWSARKRSQLLLGGKLGRMVYGGGVAETLPILRLGEILQIGKNPTSGCGRISVSLAREP